MYEWAINSLKANNKDEVLKKHVLAEKVTVWLGICFKGEFALVTMDKGKFDLQ